MTVYDLIQVLAQYPSDTEVEFEAVIIDPTSRVDLAFREAKQIYALGPVIIRLLEV